MGIYIDIATAKLRNDDGQYIVPFHGLAASTMEDVATAIESAGQAQITQINSDGQSRVTEINATGQNYITQINSDGQSRVTEINAAGSTQLTQISSTGQTNVDAVNAAGSTQSASVYHTGEEQVTRVNTAGQNAVDRITEIAGSVIYKEYQTIYVSPTGNDLNDGTSVNPVMTMNKALDLGATTIVLADGVYTQTIDLRKAKSPNTIIQATNNAIIYAPSSVLFDSQGELVSGYTKVYTQTNSIQYSYSAIFQEDMPDDSTPLELPELTAFQPISGARCPDTKIVRCTSTQLQDALQEIESSSQYKFFIASSGKIYYSCPATVSATHPLIGVTDSSLFSYTVPNKSVELFNLTIKCMSVDLDELSFAKLVNCDISIANKVGIVCTNNSDVLIDNCKISNVLRLGTPPVPFDGSGIYIAHDADYSGRVSVNNCWIHDCDSYGICGAKATICVSDSVLEHITSGIQSLGNSNYICNNVLVRHCDDGFVLGIPASGLLGSKLDCYACSAVDTLRGFSLNAYYGAWVNLYNCRATDSEVGYYSIVPTASMGEVDGIMNMTDCRSYNNTTIKSANSNIHIHNTTLVA